MSIIRFWLLDINSEIVNEVPEIRLWGFDQDDHRILIIDRNLSPYFYLLLDEECNAYEVLNRVQEERAMLPAIVKIDLIERNFVGRVVQTIKVYCKIPEVLKKYATSLTNIKGIRRYLEADIRYPTRYLIDTDTHPCGWHEIEVQETATPTNIKVEKSYLALSSPRIIEKEQVPSLKILAFSMILFSVKGSPKPTQDPIVIISTKTNHGAEKQFVANNNKDKPIIQDFVQYIQAFDPDIIAGFGTNRRDWPYIRDRADHEGIQLLIDRSGAQPHRSHYGHVSITGRSNLDLYELVDEFPAIKIRTVENVADYLGVTEQRGRQPIEITDVPRLWTNEKKRLALLKHSMESAQSIHGITEVLLPFAMQLAHLTGVPLDQVGAAAVGFRTEAYLTRQAHKLGELIPSRRRRPYFPYVGAIVLKPKPGLHEQVAVLDFSAMYPNLMIAYNISPDTYIDPKDPEPLNGVYVAPEVCHRFRKNPPGLYRRVLSTLISARRKVQARLEQLDPLSTEYRVLDARQQAIKLTTNAAYGYTGWIGARWYARPVAEATSAWGRYTIQRTICLAHEVGLEVIYGDTDSVFVKFEPRKVKKFYKNVELELDLEIRSIKIYERILFTEAKKRYAGLLTDGRLDIVGWEVARSDWTKIARDVQEHTLGIILRERSPEKAIDFIRNYIIKLRAGTLSFQDLIIWKTLTKPPHAYKINAPHVAVAQRLIKVGWELRKGDMVGYVITKGMGRLYQRAVPYLFAEYKDLDLQYYEDKQVIPVATRVLSIFNITQETLTPKRETT